MALDQIAIVNDVRSSILPVDAIQSTSTTQETAIASITFVNQRITACGALDHRIQFDYATLLSILDNVVNVIRIVAAKETEKDSVDLILRLQFSRLRNHIARRMSDSNRNEFAFIENRFVQFSKWIPPFESHWP